MSKNDLINFPEKFCAAPFTQLTLSPSGFITPCCLLRHFVIGNINDMTILEAWNSPKLIELRDEFLSGNIVTCSKSMKNNSCHKAHEHLLENISPKTTLNDSSLIKLDLRLNGSCNLKCIMCSVWKIPNGVYNNENFWDYSPLHVFPNLVEIELLGGEPFIQQDTFKLINEVYKINQKCIWTFTTNANWELKNEIIELLNMIHIKEIRISIDSLNKKIFEEIRLGSKFENIIKNLDRLIDFSLTHKNKFRIVLDMAVQKKNYTEVREFYDYSLSKNIQPSFIFVETPDEFSLLTSSYEVILNSLEIFSSLYRDTNDSKILKLISPLLKKLNKQDRLNYIDFFTLK